jgi:hypothetical protein
MEKGPKIGLNDEGRIVGESHHRAKFTDEQVEQMREMREMLHEDGTHVWSFGMIARTFGTTKGYVHEVVSHHRRNQVAVRIKPRNR